MHDEARLAKPARGSAPSRRILLEHDAGAEVPRELWDHLVHERGLAARLTQEVLEAYWSADVRGAVASAVVFDLQVEEDGEG